MKGELKIAILKIDLDKWGPYNRLHDFFNVVLHIEEQNGNTAKLKTYLGPSQIMASIRKIIEEKEVKDEIWGIGEIHLDIVWVDRHTISITLIFEKTTRFSIKMPFLDFCSEVLSYLEKVQTILDEKSISQGYSEYQINRWRESYIKEFDKIVASIDSWKAQVSNTGQ